ncbi:MAG: TonB-dependent receptor [Bacteroidota bacterium]
MRTQLLVALMMLSSFAWAKDAKLVGRILDNTGLPLPGATIRVGDRGTISNVEGYYTLVSLPTGSVTISVSYIGFEDVEATLELNSGTNRYHVDLTPGVIINDEVVVMGDRLLGQAKALNQQRTNSNITNIVASDQIGRFPDANIGDALKRVPGITMQNDQGEARNIIIRGMAPQLNAVTLNGERIPSAEGDNRNVQMDLIPADMIQTIEVNKAVLPSMDADAIGGSVNLVTRSAPNGLRVSGTAATGLNLLSNKPIWTGGLIVGDRVLDDKLGVIFSASYNNHNFGSDNVEAVWIENDNAGVTIDEFDIREYRVQRIRRSTSLALDYEINANHTLTLSGMYNWRDDWENRFRMRVSQLEDAFDDGAFTETSPGVFDVTDARVQYQTKGGIGNNRVDNRRLEDQRVYNLTASGKHLFNKLQATWNLTLARASESRPNERYMSYRESGQNVTVDITNPEFPNAFLTNSADNLAIGIHEITEENQLTFDQDLNGRLDFTLPYSEQGILKFGGRFRLKNKNRDNDFFEYEFLDEAPVATIGDVSNQDYSDPNYLAGSQYQAGIFAGPEYLGGLDLNDASVFEATEVLEEYIPGNYSATENIYAGYVMADHQFGQALSVVAGLRYEFTDLTYTGNIYDLDNETTTTDTRTNSYGNLLPGVHLRYEAPGNTIVRAAWTNTIARPNYFDLVPYAEFSPADQELVRGNPNLLPSTAMNFDLMAEKYFQTVGLVSGGAFYKSIDNFIYVQTLQNYSDPAFGTDLEFEQPQNGGTATVFGFETSFQRQLWKGLGLYLNYTRTESSTTGIEGREADEIALPGTAKNMVNASLSYETEKLVARVSLNYASDYIDELGGDSFEDRYYDEQLFLDVNASYAFTPQLRLFLEGNNLTNQPLRYYQGVQSRTMQTEYYNARFNLGLKFDLAK